MNISVLIAIQMVFLLCYTELQESNGDKIKNCLKHDDHGNCMCCKSGYRGPTCEIHCKQCSSRFVDETHCHYSCRNGHYGDTCNKKCPTTCACGVGGDHFCTETNGTIRCDYGCIKGYTGKQCSNCKDSHYYGDHCIIMCSKGCVSETCNRTGHCILGCVDGFYGDRCYFHCGSNCIRGKCTQDIISTYVCTEGCVDGYMGSNCAKKCPVQCATCEQLNGNCITCVANYVHMPETGECTKQPENSIWILHFMGILCILCILCTLGIVRVVKKCKRGNAIKEGESTTLLNNKDDESDMSSQFVETAAYKAARDQLQQGNVDPVTYFTYPLHYFIDEMENLADKSDMEEWVYLLLCGGNCDDDDDDDDVVRPVQRLVQHNREIKVRLRQYIGVYLDVEIIKGRVRVCFSHPAIYDACLFVVDRKYPGFLMKYCKVIFEKEEEELIPKHNTDVWLTQIVEDLKQEKSRRSLSHGVLGTQENIDRKVTQVGDRLKDIVKTEDDSVVDDNKVTILHVACYSDNVKFVRYLLTLNNANINVRGQLGRTPVMCAAIKGCRRVFDFLVTKGADLSVVDDAKDTILHVACLSDNVEFVKYLLTLNIADINVRGQFGRTPVMHAAHNGCREVFDLLVSKGANLSVVGGNTDTILHVACLKDNVEFVKYLLTLNIANINARGQYGWTPVKCAANKGCRRVFDLLVSEGANLSVVDENEDTILHVACCSDNVEFVKYLLTLNIADINVRGQFGRTPVMHAAENGCREVFDLLLRNKADLLLKDKHKETILHVACLSDNVEFVKYLLTLNIADINVRGQNEWTPVMCAAREGCRRVFDLLKSEGADVSVVDGNEDTILHVACYNDNVEFVKYLLTLNIADTNVRGQYGRTPVMCAAKEGCRRVFDLLVRNISDLNAVDDIDYNILHLACMGGNVEVVKYLLSLNTLDINRRTSRGQTPAMIAKQWNNLGVVDLLVQKGGQVE